MLDGTTKLKLSSMRTCRVCIMQVIALKGDQYLFHLFGTGLAHKNVSLISVTVQRWFGRGLFLMI